jgi:hypothetical protein
MTIPLVIGVNPLQTTLFELGIVSGRVALLLRSAEIHPVFVRFVSLREQSRIPSQLLPAPSSREGFGWLACTSENYQVLSTTTYYSGNFASASARVRGPFASASASALAECP